MKMKRPIAAIAATAIMVTSAFYVAPTATAEGAHLTVAQAEQLGSDDPNLQQNVTAEEEVVPEGTTEVFESGHADMGPLLRDGKLGFYIRDDRATPPVWRAASDVVFPLKDTAAMTLPDNTDYDFTGATAGSRVWLVPQTQQQDVPWLGWNTQAPSIVDSVDRGITLEYVGHQGPGQFSVFLQNGGFDKPQQLWNSGSKQKQSTWVDLNTHTHANWVFTEPGVHLVAMRIKATMLDGSVKTATSVLRFAVGDTPVEEATSAQWEGELASGDVDAPDSADSNNGGNLVLWISLSMFVVAAVLIGLGLRNRANAKRRKANAQQNTGAQA